MKKSGLSILLLVLVAPCFACSSNVSKATAGQKEVVVEYSTFQNHPVEMVYDPNDGRVELRIRFNGSDSSLLRDDGYLDFLKQEVLRITSASQPVALGKSGYKFRFLGGHPIWAPYDGMYITQNYSCLSFAEGGSITADKVIQARGSKEVHGYDGYALWKPNWKPGSGK